MNTKTLLVAGGTGLVELTGSGCVTKLEIPSRVHQGTPTAGRVWR